MFIPTCDTTNHLVVNIQSSVMTTSKVTCHGGRHKVTDMSKQNVKLTGMMLTASKMFVGYTCNQEVIHS